MLQSRLLRLPNTLAALPPSTASCRLGGNGAALQDRSIRPSSSGNVAILDAICFIVTLSHALQVRQAFTADLAEGNTLIVADYGQLELRLLAVSPQYIRFHNQPEGRFCCACLAMVRKTHAWRMGKL